MNFKIFQGAPWLRVGSADWLDVYNGHVFLRNGVAASLSSLTCLMVLKLAKPCCMLGGGGRAKLNDAMRTDGMLVKVSGFEFEESSRCFCGEKIGLN